MKLNEISRLAENPPIPSVIYNNLKLTVCKLKEIHQSDRVVISDLTLGPVIGNHIRCDFSKQIKGKSDLNDNDNPLLMIDDSLDFACQIGRLIDAECAGNQSIVNDINYAEALLSNASDQAIVFLVLPPLNDYIWGNDNIRFLRTFNNIIRNYNHKVIIAYHHSLKHNQALIKEHSEQNHILNEEVTQNHSSEFNYFYQIPGILPVNLKEKKDIEQNAIFIGSQGFVLDPYVRKRDKASVEVLHFLDQQQEEFEYYHAIRALLYVKLGIVKEEIANVLRKEAYKRFAEGGFELSELMLKHAINIVSGMDYKGSLLIQLQTNMIFQMRFTELANMEIQNFSVTNPIIYGYLLQNKGWGNTMIGNNQAAKEMFSVVRNLLRHKVPIVNYLYLLNISARSHAMIKDLDTAFAMEQEIEECISKMAIKDWHIAYINCLNIARLYKFAKNYYKAEIYYIKAFQTSLGVRSKSDFIFGEITLAELKEITGQKDEALIYIVRSAIYFLAMKVPESIAPRVANTILGKEFFNNDYSIEEIAKCFLEKLKIYGIITQATYKINFTTMPKLLEENSLSKENLIAEFVPGVGFYYTSSSIYPYFDGKYYNTLKSTIAQYLYDQAGIKSKISGTLIFDENQGVGIPFMLSELACSSFLHSITNIGKTIKKDQFNKLKTSVKIILNPAVRYFTKGINDNIIVNFKRYLNPLTISYQECVFLQKVMTEENNFNIFDISKIIPFIDKSIIMIVNND